MVGTGVLQRPIAYLNGVPAGVMEAVEPQRKGVAVTRSLRHVGAPVRNADRRDRAVCREGWREAAVARSGGWPPIAGVWLALEPAVLALAAGDPEGGQVAFEKIDEMTLLECP